MKRITIDIDDELYKRLKLLSAIRNISLSTIVRQSILKRIVSEEQFIILENNEK